MLQWRRQKADDQYLWRDGSAGLFLAASQFPRNRETRAPLIEEILTVKDQLDPKHKYIAEAPVTDDEGNKTVLRFRRKTKEQYVMSEDRKSTRLNSSHVAISYAVFCLKKKKKTYL